MVQAMSVSVDSSLVNTTAAFSAAGRYVLQLEASDRVLTTSSQITVTIREESSGRWQYW